MGTVGQKDYKINDMGTVSVLRVVRESLADGKNPGRNNMIIEAVAFDFRIPENYYF